MLTIRLTRKGKKNQPFFRIVVIDKRRSASGGNAVETVGNIDPLTKKKVLKKERILYWISKGAKPTATVHNLLVSEKIIDAKKIAKKSKKPAVVATPATPATAPAQVQVEIKKEEVKPAEEAKPVVAEKPVEEQKPEQPKA
jgi:small subunit ribosomal protein S16